MIDRSPHDVSFASTAQPGAVVGMIASSGPSLINPAEAGPVQVIMPTRRLSPIQLAVTQQAATEPPPEGRADRPRPRPRGHPSVSDPKVETPSRPENLRSPFKPCEFLLRRFRRNHLEDALD